VRVWLVLLFVIGVLLASCANSTQVEPPQKCRESEDVAYRFEDIAVRAERNFLRELPALVMRSSNKPELIDRVYNFGNPMARVSELTPREWAARREAKE